MPNNTVMWSTAFASKNVTIYTTQLSNFLTNRIIFVLKHKLLPCLQQRLPQVYGKMYIHITGGVVMGNFILYIIFISFNLVYLIQFYFMMFYTLDIIDITLFILFYFILFFHFILFDIGIPSHLTYLFKNLYTQQTQRIHCNRELSCEFHVRKGA